MARLFIFAIGGTGSRVLKSLTMLLAAGIKPNSDINYEIVPIIIDPHKANEDLKRTIRLIDNYQKITKDIGLENGFFGTEITTINNLVNSENKLSSTFTYNLQQVSDTKFRDYIDFDQLDESNKALADLLFSGNSVNKRGEKVNLLDLEMDIGFIGNPNIGSVVLNQFKDSNEFKEFSSIFNSEDRIFIVSSIFGGTGAAGFPIILKNIRDAKNNPNIDGKEFLENAKIGAVSVLPYFNIEKEPDSPIQKSDFISKTKSALSYYKDNVTGNNSVNSLYYIADDYSGKPYKNDPGENGQKNPAHFIELASALAIIDFLETPDSELQSIDGSAVDPIYKEFGIRNNSEKIKFSDFEDYTERKLSLSLSQFELFRKFLDKHLKSSLSKQAWSTDKPEIDQQFIDNTFYRTYLTEFLDAFKTWLIEMDDNKRGFSPFNFDSDIKTMIKDRKVKSGWLSGKVDHRMMDGKLSKHSKGKDYVSPSQKLISLFNETTKDILIKKFGLKE